MSAITFFRVITGRKRTFRCRKNPLYIHVAPSEEQKRIEQQRLEEEQRRMEQQRLEEEQRQMEQQRLEEEPRQMEQQRLEEEHRHLVAERKKNNVCQYCGGRFKGLFTKVCSECGRRKDY